MEPDDARLAAILRVSRTIAVVGLSPRLERPSNQVARYLVAAGYRVIPVNPGHAEILGLPCFPNLRQISEPVDMVNVFRRASQVLPIVEDAIAIGAKVLWLQLGVVNEEAADLAARSGLSVVMDRCIKIDHAALGIERGHAAGSGASRTEP